MTELWTPTGMHQIDNFDRAYQSDKMPNQNSLTLYQWLAGQDCSNPRRLDRIVWATAEVHTDCPHCNKFIPVRMSLRAGMKENLYVMCSSPQCEQGFSLMYHQPYTRLKVPINESLLVSLNLSD